MSGWDRYDEQRARINALSEENARLKQLLTSMYEVTVQAVSQGVAPTFNLATLHGMMAAAGSPPGTPRRQNQPWRVPLLTIDVLGADEIEVPTGPFASLTNYAQAFLNLLRDCGLVTVSEASSALGLVPAVMQLVASGIARWAHQQGRPLPHEEITVSGELAWVWRDDIAVIEPPSMVQMPRSLHGLEHDPVDSSPMLAMAPPRSLLSLELP